MNVGPEQRPPVKNSTSDTGRAEPVVTATAHPSLALVKYWGKERQGINLPSTGSIGISLQALTTVTTVRRAEQDRITINGEEEDPSLFQPVLNGIRGELEGAKIPAFPVDIDSTNSFPTAAGLASSASGLAALVTAVWYAAEWYAAARASSSSVFPADTPFTPPPELLPRLSALARLGSGSAARSICGGFVLWGAGEQSAREIHPPEWWPELRVVVLPISDVAKSISSRSGMNHTRESSPYYDAWVKDAPVLLQRAQRAIAERELAELGTVMRLSYLRMFGTMLAADPPVLYWLPPTVEALHRLHHLRERGIPAWETMDAGPQVKVLTTADYAPQIADDLRDLCISAPIISTVGPGVTVSLHDGTKKR